MKKYLFAALVLIRLAASGQEPHDHHNHQQQPAQVPDTSDSKPRPHVHETEHNLFSHFLSLSLPANRNGSGTAWLTDNSPMHGYMLNSDNWNFMFHGNIFLRYTMQNINNDYLRGDKQFDAPNWFMAMGQRKTGQNGLFATGLMLSLDPFTMGGNGYPLLFQSGETWKNEPLIDRQHPHDLFSSLYASYSQQLNENADVFLYLGYPGEPAIGPVAFMHRPSALTNPDAPLGHHWQDATHITFGVATAGYRYKKLKAEASIFTGREPDEERYNFDKPLMDSYAGRLSYNASTSLALQVSSAFLKSPEAVNPNQDVMRYSVGAIHSIKNINSTIAWGLNDAGGDHLEHSFLAESNAQLNKMNVYFRYEFVQKSSDELGITATDDVHDHEILNIHALTAGLSHQLFSSFNTTFNLGAQGTVNFINKDLEKHYGEMPFSAEIYLRVTPELMQH